MLDRESWLQGGFQGPALLCQGLGPACWGSEGAHEFKAACLRRRFILITPFCSHRGGSSQVEGRSLIRALVAVPMGSDPSVGRSRAGAGRVDKCSLPPLPALLGLLATICLCWGGWGGWGGWRGPPVPVFTPLPLTSAQQSRPL